MKLKTFTLSILLLSALGACKPIKPTGDISDIRGRVFSIFYNAPLANAEIYIPEIQGRVKTDLNGYFQIQGLPTRWLNAKVSHESHDAVERQVLVEPFGTKYLEFWLGKASDDHNPTIVFERNYDIWTTDRYGRKQKNLTEKMPRILYRTHPVWSQDKSQISYLAYDGTQKLSTMDGIWMMQANGTMPRKLTSIQEVGRVYGLDWSNNGENYLFMLQNRIFTYHTGSGVLRGLNSQLARAGVFENFDYDMGPVWTPDQKQILFSEDAIDLSLNYRNSPLQRQIFVMQSDGGQRRQLTFKGDNYNPAVSHDGKKVAYISTLSGKPQVWLMDIDGSSPQRLTNLEATKVSHPRWSADDQSIYFTSDHLQRYRSTYPKELWHVNRFGGQLYMLSNDAAHADG